MSDLISRQDIIGYIDRVRNCGLGKKKSLEYISKYVERVPSAEAVQVVRCKDCKHHHECCRGTIPLNPDGYCSDGSRKERNNE